MFSFVSVRWNFTFQIRNRIERRETLNRTVEGNSFINRFADQSIVWSKNIGLFYGNLHIFFYFPPMRSDSSYLHLASTFNNAATHDCLLWVKCSLFRECGHKILPKTDMFSKIDWQRFSFVWIRYSEMGKEIPETQFLTPKIDNNSKHNTNFLCIYGFWGDGCVEIWDVYCCGGGGCVKNRYVFHSTVLKVLTIEIAVRPHFYHTPHFKWSTNVQSIRVVFWFWQAMFLPITMHDCRRDGPARQYTLMWQKQPILCLPTNKHTIFGHYFHFYL